RPAGLNLLSPGVSLRSARSHESTAGGRSRSSAGGLPARGGALRSRAASSRYRPLSWLPPARRDGTRSSAERSERAAALDRGAGDNARDQDSPDDPAQLSAPSCLPALGHELGNARGEPEREAGGAPL